MREILFRGKRKGTGEWVYGNYAFTDNNSKQHFIFQNKAFEYEVSPKSVGQYTGLTDENGKKIFEGDIVKSCEYDDIYTIKYFDADNYPAFDCVPEVPSCECNGLTFLVNTEGCEIIGNIYDNPELLSHRENLGN